MRHDYWVTKAGIKHTKKSNVVEETSALPKT